MGPHTEVMAIGCKFESNVSGPDALPSDVAAVEKDACFRAYSSCDKRNTFGPGTGFALACMGWGHGASNGDGPRTRSRHWMQC